MPSGNRVFLAHAREDKPQVRDLYERLQERGFDPWLDEVDLIPGQIWTDEIPKAIADAGVFLAFLSNRSVSKVGYVQNEFRRALAAFGKRPPGSIFLIPVRLDDCEVPDLRIAELELSLQQIQWVDLFEENGFDRLVTALELALKGDDPINVMSPADRDQEISTEGPEKPLRGSEIFNALMGAIALLVVPLLILALVLELTTSLYHWFFPGNDVQSQVANGTSNSSEEQKSNEIEVAADYEPFEVFQDCRYCPEMVMLPAGKFFMGSLEDEAGLADNESPRHEVTISQPFALGKYEVTFEEYNRFADATDRDQPGDEGWGQGRRPVILVTWHDAGAYCSWLSKETNKHYRLPTEAEWEYAARAGTTTPLSFVETISTDQANYNGDYSYPYDPEIFESKWRQETVPVGTFPANPWGLHEMHGNVYEWVSDWYGRYSSEPVTDPKGPDTTGAERERVIRGGSWERYGEDLRSAARSKVFQGGRSNDLGFRCARAQEKS